MTDFASALLLSLVERAATGRGVPGSATPPLDARGSFDAKRQLLQALYVEHGPAAVLAIGDQARSYGPHPTLDVLLRAESMPDLVVRWQRIERFVHSHHRLRVLRAGSGTLDVEHVSTDDDPPAAAEDLLILGVVVALAERIGIVGLSASVGGTDGHASVRYALGRWHVECESSRHIATADWRFGWTPGAPGTSAASHVRPPPDADADPADGELVERLLRHVMDDCCRTWQLDELAAAARLSSRTLQRRLATAGTSFSALVRTAQVRLAGRLLLEDRMPVAHVGLSAGFSDQAHFTREFKRRVGVSPAKYRELFSATSTLDRE